MEVRRSPRRRTPSAKQVATKAHDRVHESRVVKQTSKAQPRHASATASASVNSRRQSRSQHPTPARRSRSATPAKTKKTVDRRTASNALDIDMVDAPEYPPQLSSVPQTSKARDSLMVKRTRPSSSGHASQQDRPDPQWPRGYLISPTNAQKIMVHGKLRPNPFFEYMPAPGTLNKSVPLHFLAGETTKMQAYISEKVAKGLARGRPQPTASSSNFFGRLVGRLGFGKARSDDVGVTGVKLPPPWDLPAVSDAEVEMLAETLPRRTLTRRW